MWRIANTFEYVFVRSGIGNSDITHQRTSGRPECVRSGGERLCLTPMEPFADGTNGFNNSRQIAVVSGSR